MIQIILYFREVSFYNEKKEWFTEDQLTVMLNELKQKIVLMCVFYVLSRRYRT